MKQESNVEEASAVQQKGHHTIIVFDLGGVLIDWNPRHLYRQMFEDEERMEWFLENICTSAWNAEQDAGRPFEDGVRLLIERHPEYERQIRAYADRWEEMLGGAIEGSVRVLADLKAAGHPIYALTNWSAETFPHAEERYDFLDWFEGIVVSGDICLKKPDPAIFHHLMETHEIEADEAVFIDDSEKNVEAARELGFGGILFESPEQLRTELTRLGFLPRSATTTDS